MKKIKFLIALFILLVFPIVSVHANRCSDYTMDDCPIVVAEGLCECEIEGQCYLTPYSVSQTCHGYKTQDECEKHMFCGWNTTSSGKGVCARGVSRKIGVDYDYSCVESKYFPIFQLLKFIIVLIQIAVPFALIIWGSLDWFKALIAHDEKEMRMKRKPFVSRVIAALLVFLLPFLLQFISKFIAGTKKTNSFWLCYSEAEPIIDFRNIQDSTRSGKSGVTNISSPSNIITNTSGKPENPKNTDSNNNGSGKPENPKNTDSSSTWGDAALDLIDRLKDWYNNNDTSGGKNEERREGTWADNDPANNSTTSTCSEYSYIDCPKTDSQGNPCTRGHVDDQSGAVCMPNTDAKTCSDYLSDYCPPSDDYDYACEATPNCNRVTNAQGKEMTKAEYDQRKADEERMRQIQQEEEEQRRNNGGNAR